MELLRVPDSSGRPVVAVRSGPGDVPRRVPVASLAALLAQPVAQLRPLLADALATGEELPTPAAPLPPVDGGTEVWACGVTYVRSRDARTEESSVKDVYERVYDA